MKIVRTKDGRTLYKGDDGRWFKHADFKTGKLDHDFRTVSGKNGSVDVYDGTVFLGNALDSKEVEQLKNERKAEIKKRDARIEEINKEIKNAKLCLEDPNIADRWTRTGYRNKIKKLTAELKELKNK